MILLPASFGPCALTRVSRDCCGVLCMLWDGWALELAGDAQRGNAHRLGSHGISPELSISSREG